MRARPSAPTTHCFLLPTRYSLLVPFVVHLHLRQRTAQLPCGRARARQPRTTFYPLLPTLLKKNIRGPFVSIRGSIICPFVVFVVFVVSFLNVRTAQLSCGRARARQPRTTFYPLLPTLLKKNIRGPFVSIRGSIICPFVVFVVSFLNVRTAIFAVLNGSPLHSDHALLSTFSSLFSTRIMLYKVP